MARLREFDPDAALSAIKNLFWERGYEGASLSDIERVTGLNKQSLYRLYGDKRGMYLHALIHYEQNEVTNIGRLLMQNGTAYERFERLLQVVVGNALSTNDRRGCFLCNAAADQAQLDPASLSKVREMTERGLAAFETALEISEPYASSLEKRSETAAGLHASYNGIRILIKSGVSGDVLWKAVRSALGQIA